MKLSESFTETNILEVIRLSELERIRRKKLRCICRQTAIYLSRTQATISMAMLS